LTARECHACATEILVPVSAEEWMWY